MEHHPVIFSIAGSDCSGGAGIQADIKTISALGGYAASAVTAVTVQNTLGVSAVYAIPPDIVCGQIEAVLKDLQPVAIKIGMVNDIDTVRIIVDCLQKYQSQHIVYDPVMVSTSGRKLMTEEAIEETKNTLLPLATLITPNLNEAGILSGKKIESQKDMEEATQKIADTYHTSVLIKGGHLSGSETLDILRTRHRTFIFEGRKIESKNLHGTGCTLSSAIATYLGKRYSMQEAVRLAKNYITQTIIAGKDLNIGQGNGPLWHFPPAT